jgi:hypothetical protein
VEVFAPQAELATAGDYVSIAFSLRKLAHAAEQLERVVLDNASFVDDWRPQTNHGRRKREREMVAIGSVEELERLVQLK